MSSAMNKSTLIIILVSGALCVLSGNGYVMLAWGVLASFLVPMFFLKKPSR